MRFQGAADRLMAIRPVIPPIVVRSAPCLGVISSTIRLITAQIAVSGRYAAFIMLGWAYYALFTLSVALVVAPLSEMSEILEKVIPVTTYLMVPFSGAFFLVGYLSPEAAAVALYSPPVHGMEMMRYGLFGPSIDPQYDYLYPLKFCLPCMALGLLLCRMVRKRLVVE